VPPGGGQRFSNSSGPSELRPSGGRVPPHDLDAEAAVLSAVMLAQEAFDRVAEFLRPEHFYSGANQRVFEAVLALQSESHPVDVITVAGWLRDKGLLQQIGGTAYLAQLTDAIPTIAHVEAHGKVVREKWRLRRVIATCQDFAAVGYGDTGDVQGFIDQAEQAIFDLARTPEASSVVSLKHAIHGAFGLLSEAAKRGGGITGFATGFHDLDKMTAGLHPGDLYIVAARPGMGKTSFVLNLAAQLAEPRRVVLEGSTTPAAALGTGVVVFSLEMPREQLASRLLASDASVDVSKLRSGNIGKEDWINLTESASKLGHLPLWLDDTPAIGLLDLRARVRRLQAEVSRRSSDGPKAEKLGLVVIDYLQLMSGRQGAQSREQEISELSRGLKQLAKEMSVAVIALSQLNRSVETRSGDKRPQLSDLRESGAIEQDADCIMFIYRDDYYHADSAEQNTAELIVAKQRNGPTGKIMLHFNKACTRFENRASEEYAFNELDGFQDGSY
jgi:replicative DNA helicase